MLLLSFQVQNKFVRGILLNPYRRSALLITLYKLPLIVLVPTPSVRSLTITPFSSNFKTKSIMSDRLLSNFHTQSSSPFSKLSGRASNSITANLISGSSESAELVARIMYSDGNAITVRKPIAVTAGKAPYIALNPSAMQCMTIRSFRGINSQCLCGCFPIGQWHRHRLFNVFMC